ncbi:MAG: carboxypeptidase regulatory-like domain-containing protein [Limimaricola sp.]
MAGKLAAEPARAGLRIVNIAHVSYFHAGLGIRETVSSNPVEAVVQAVPALDLGGGSDLRLPRAVSAAHRFTLTNTGNTDLEVEPWISVVDRSAPIENGRLFWDRDGNGKLDHTEPQIGAAPLRLAPGEEIRLIHLFDLAPRAAIGDTLHTVLRARAVAATPGREVEITGEARGRVTIVEAGLELRKSVARNPRPEGEVLTYTLTLQNDGQTAIGLSDSIEGAALLVDGERRRGLLVADPIPLNTVFAGPGTAHGLQPLYHVEGAPAHSYRSTPPGNHRAVDAVAFLSEMPLDAGHARRMSFRVRVPPHAGTVAIPNRATAFAPDIDGTRRVPSNTVSIRHDGAGGGLAYVDGARRPLLRGSLGEDLRLRLLAGACNATRGRDRVEINVASRRTGDLETVLAIETGFNTGRFEAPPLPVARMALPVAGDGVLAATRGDLLVATATCGAMQFASEFEIDPGSYVFDSVDNAPVSGAKVMLLDGTGKQTEAVFTDAEGFFALGERPAGRYRYSVEAPGYAYPSARRVFEGFARQLSSNAASWGEAFRHSAGPVAQGDLPVDPSYGIPIAVDKKADRDRVSTGGHVVYTLSLRNEMSEALLDARLRDALPFGASIIGGSVTLDGARIARPERAGDGTHDFEIGRIAPGAARELRYALRFGAAARAGRNHNTARLSGLQAGTGLPVRSAAARATVTLDDRGGVFAEDATITGSVFLDCDGDGLRGGAAEPGIPGVRIATQGGLFAVTDIDGQYSFRNLPPQLHALSPSRATLPADAAISRSRSGDLRGGGTRRVALKRGELRAEHFAVSACTAAIRAEVAQRIVEFEARGGRASREVSDLPVSRRSGGARGVVSEAGRATASQIYTRSPNAATQADRLADARPPLAEAIEGFDSAPAFLDIEDGARLDRRIVSLRVKGPADLDLVLRINGVAVPFDRIGEKTAWADGNVQAIDYVALELAEGANEIALEGLDPFGNDRVRLKITVFAPGAPAALALEAPRTAPATAGAAVPVTLRLTDRAGLPVMSSAIVSLRTTLGEWDAADLQPAEPGVQVFVAEGRLDLTLRAPQVPGRGRLFASADFGQTETDIVFVPNLAARELVGVIEATAPTGGDLVSPFEQGHAGLSGEVYLRGALGDTLVTLHYDSRAEETGLFRDDAGNAGFPVFGDVSEQGSDARSSNGFYLRLDRAGSSVVHGDISAAPSLDRFRLGGAGRLVNGATYALDTERAALTLFAARTDQGQRRVEIAGRGITGPYDIDLSGIVAGSDRAWRVTRDRDTGRLLSEVRLERLTDYVLDYFTDSIILDEPLLQADAEGHPVSIRLVFETERAEDRYWLYGGDVRWTPTETVEIGARLQHADAARGTPERERLQAAYLRRQLDEDTLFEVELARSENASGRSGGAARVRAARERSGWEGELELVHAGRDFEPAGAPTQPGSSVLNARLAAALSPTSRVEAESELRRDHVSDNDTASLRLGHEYDLSPRLTRRSAFRLTHGEATAAWLGAGAVWRPATDRPLEFDLLLEQAVWGGEEGLLSFGAEHDLTRRWSISGEAELGVALDGTVGNMRQLRFSTGYDLAEWLRGRTELTRTKAEAAQGRVVQGLQADWSLGAWAFGLGLEHSEPISGDGDSLTSISISADWQAGDESWILETDVDRSFEREAASLSTNLGIAGQLSRDWTFLGRSRYAREERANSPDRQRHRLRVGAAYRPVHDPRLDLLAWYEHRLEREQTEESEHMWSVAGSWQAGRNLQINTRYSGHLAGLDLDPGRAGMTRDDVLTQLAQIGASWDLFDDRIALGSDVMRIWDDRGAATTAFGGELGLAVGDGAMLSVGYNASRRRPQGADALYEDGVYVRVRMAFDDRLWQRLEGFLDR